MADMPGAPVRHAARRSSRKALVEAGQVPMAVAEVRRGKALSLVAVESARRHRRKRTTGRPDELKTS